MQHVPHHANVVDELIVGRREGENHVGDEIGHRRRPEPPAFEHPQMTLDRLFPRIPASGDLRGSEGKPRKSIGVRTGSENIDPIVLRLVRGSDLRLDHSVAELCPNLFQLFQKP